MWCGGQLLRKATVTDSFHTSLPLCSRVNFTTLPEILKEVQKARAENDPRASMIYRSIGVYLGYAIAHYADFYQLSNLLLLGRVSSGKGGDEIINEAARVLKEEFPGLNVQIHIPDETFKRHGQAVIAASL